MSPSSAAAFGAHYSMETPTTSRREKLDPLHFNMIAQISPSTVRSSLMEQDFDSHQISSDTANTNNNAHWIDFSADNDFQQMDNLFQQQQEQNCGDDTSSIPVGSDVDLGGSLTEDLDFGDEDDVKLDSEFVDDERALRHMKELLGGKVTSRSKQILLAAQQQASQRPSNQRLSTCMPTPNSPKLGGPSFIVHTGDDSNHSSSRCGSNTNQAFQPSIGSSMSISTDPAGDEETHRKMPSKSKKKSKQSSSSEKRSDKKSSSKKKKKSNRSKDDDKDGGFPSVYLPLHDDGSACIEDIMLPDGSIQLFSEDQKILSTDQTGHSLLNLLHSSFEMEKIGVPSVFAR